MNKIYRLVWNKTTGSVVVASELASGDSVGAAVEKPRNSASQRRALAAAILFALAGSASFPALADIAQDSASGATCTRTGSTGAWTCSVPNGAGGFATVYNAAGTGITPNWATLSTWVSANLGSNAIVLGDATTKATGANSLAAGVGASTNSPAGVAIGSNANATSANGIEGGDIAIGSGALATNQNGGGGASVAIGQGASALNSSVAVGNGATTSSAHSVAIGNSARSGIGGVESVAIGFRSQSGTQGTALGNYANAVGVQSAALGTFANSSGDQSIALGVSSASSAQFATAVGHSAQASAQNAFAGGASAKAGAVNAIALGNGAQATGTSSISIGTGNVVSGNNSGAIGDPTTITGSGSYSLGNNNTIGANNAFVVGNNVSVPTGLDGAVVLGDSSTVTTSTPTSTGTINGVTYTYAGGAPAAGGVVSVGAAGAERQIQNVAAGRVSATSTDAINGSQLYATNQAIAAGQTHYYSVNDNGVQQANYNNNGATGANSVAAGPAASASGAGSVAMGLGAAASAGNAIAIGTNASAQGDTNPIAIGQNSVANGHEATAFGFQSNATGAFTTALGVNARAKSWNALAVGNWVDATGLNSAALGSNSTASNTNATAVGNGSTATGLNSTALGGGLPFSVQGPIASADNSVAIGTGSQATIANSVALGNGSLTNAATPTPAGTINGVTYTYAGGAPTGVVSVGAVGSERQIQNVAAGQVTATSTDAINGSQLFATNQAIAAAQTHYYSVNDGSTPQANYNNDGATGANALAAGTNATATGAQSVAMGDGAQGNGNRVVSIGVNAGQGASGPFNVAIGENAGINASGSSNTAIGDVTGQNVAGNFNAAFGTSSGSYTQGDYNTSAGYNAGVQTVGNGNSAFGMFAGLQTAGNNNVAFGSIAGIQVTHNDTVSIGSNSLANAQDGDVALGSGSTTSTVVATPSGTINGVTYNYAGINPASTVSVGAVGAERTITNVAAGRVSSTSTDAINGSQLYATNQAITNVAAIANQGWNISAQGANATNVAPGASVDLNNADGNIKVSKSTTSNDVTFDLNPDLTVTSVTTGNTVMNTNGLTILGGPSITNLGINAGNMVITNVAPGVAPTDAVNVSQLNSVTTGVTTAGMNFTGNDNAAGDVHRDLGQTLAIKGDATTAGTYSGGNIKTVTDPTTGAINIQMADSPKFGNVTINDGGSGKITGVTAGDVSATSTDAVNGSQLYQVSQAANAGWNLSANGGAATNVAPGATVNVSQGSSGNIVVTQSGTNLTIDTNPNLTATSVTTGNTVMNNAGVTVSGGPNGTVTLANTGLNNGGNTITNVAAGVNDTDAVNVSQLKGVTTGGVQYDKNADGTVNYNSVTLNPGGTGTTVIRNVSAGVAPTDAVNVGQLQSGLNQTLTQANAYTDARVNALQGDIWAMKRGYRGAAASAMAAAGLPQAYLPGKSMLSGAVGGYQGQYGIAVGLSAISDNGRWVYKAQLSGNTQHDWGFSVGAGIQW